MRGLFVTGTDTAAGKTAVSAALVAAITASGEPVRAYKPVVTGLEDQLDRRTGWPHDHELLASLAAMTPADVSPLRYGPAASPHLAAQLAGERIAAADLLAAAQTLAQIARPERDELARAGESLPWRRWLARSAG